MSLFGELAPHEEERGFLKLARRAKEFLRKRFVPIFLLLVGVATLSLLALSATGLLKWEDSTAIVALLGLMGTLFMYLAIERLAVLDELTHVLWQINVKLDRMSDVPSATRKIDDVVTGFRELNRNIPPRALLNQIEKRLRGSYSWFYPNPEEAYGAALRLLTKKVPDRTIHHAVLYSHPKSRGPQHPRAAEVHRNFQQALDDCIRGSGPGRGRVLQIINITSHARLADLEQRLDALKEAEGYEVKVAVLPNSVHHFPFIIIGAEDVLFGPEALGHDHVTHATHLSGDSYGKMMRQFFYQFWNDQTRFIPVKNTTGVLVEGIDEVRRRLDETAKVQPKKRRVRRGRQGSGGTEGEKVALPGVQISPAGAPNRAVGDVAGPSRSPRSVGPE